MILGVEIGGTKLQVVLGDEAGKIGERRKMAVDPAKGAAGIRQQIEQAVLELTRGRRILRAGRRLRRAGGLEDGPDLRLAPR